MAHGYQIIDVRSSGEFFSGRIPGSVNIALFDENERSVIGTLYNHGGKERAIDQGFAYVESKLNGLLAAFEVHRESPVAIYCARGGMRSLSVVNLLRQSGYQAFQIEGGYKKYRHAVLELLADFRPRLIVIHGLTGTGKTRILQHLEGSIDLEELARHRSSLFGGLDRQPSNQRNFESRLADLIPRLGEQPYFIEGESRKIGRVFIPKPLAMAMKEAVMVNVQCSIKSRIERIIEDYPVAGEQKKQQILEILRSLTKNLGRQRVEQMCELLHSGQLHELVSILLLNYYDKRYIRSMSGYHFDLEISSENIEEAAATLLQFRQNLRAQAQGPQSSC